MGSEEMSRDACPTAQQYCLRWNNHRNNLLLVFNHLFMEESFCDVTLVCDDHFVKCHKMVLAACSSYFHSIFTRNPDTHHTVILKGHTIKDVRGVLSYMYRGTVNVNQSELSGLLNAAENLRVKGLADESPSATYFARAEPPCHSPCQNSSCSACVSARCTSVTDAGFFGPSYEEEDLPDEPAPHSEGESSRQEQERTHPIQAVWSQVQRKPSPSPSPKGFAVLENLQNEPVSLRRQRPTGTVRDTPILRTVLGHAAASMHHTAVDARPARRTPPSRTPPSRTPPTRTPPIRTPPSRTPPARTPPSRTPPSRTPPQPSTSRQHNSLNYSHSQSSNGPTDYSDKHSPVQFMDDPLRSVGSDKGPDDNPHFTNDPEDKHNVQKPEWKRYKQYTRNDIMQAIDAVKQGMSALQAARKYNVPSRTLYDKVKKMGITTNRPYRKGTYPLSPYQGLNLRTEEATGYSPEDQSSELVNGNCAGSGSNGGSETDERMESETGLELVVNPRHARASTPPLALLKEEHNEDTDMNPPDNQQFPPGE